MLHDSKAIAVLRKVASYFSREYSRVSKCKESDRGSSIKKIRSVIHSNRRTSNVTTPGIPIKLS